MRAQLCRELGFLLPCSFRLSAWHVGWARQLTVVCSTKPIQANWILHGLLEGPVGQLIDHYESRGSLEDQCMAYTCQNVQACLCGSILHTERYPVNIYLVTVLKVSELLRIFKRTSSNDCSIWALIQQTDISPKGYFLVNIWVSSVGVNFDQIWWEFF